LYFAVGSPAQGGNTGAVYLYKPSSSPSLRTILYGAQSGARFGTAVAFAKNSPGLSLAVGAPNYDVVRGGQLLPNIDEGVVSAYDLNSNLVPGPPRTLIASDGSTGDNLGSSVDYMWWDRRLVFAGAPRDNYGSTPDVGSARVWSGDIWSGFPDWYGHDATLVPANPSLPNQFLGISVSAGYGGSNKSCGDHLCHDVAVGAPGSNSGAGTANVFQEPNWGWDEATRAMSPAGVFTGNPGDSMGYSVAMSGDSSTLAIGAYGADGPRGADMGAVYVATRLGGSWSAPAAVVRLTDGAGAANDQLGRSVGISSSGHRIAAGAPFAENEGPGGTGDQGLAFTWDRPSSGWAYDNSPNQMFAAFLPSPAGRFAANLTLSENGKDLLIGAPFNFGGGNVQYYSYTD
jgi:hypothetical protein